MFGYILPYKPEMRIMDFALYRAFYCGICKCHGKNFGQFPRFLTNHDVTFFAVLMCDYLKTEIEVKPAKCVLNPVRSKPVVRENPTLKKIAAANVLLGAAKLKDDARDGDGGAGGGAARFMLRGAVKKAEKILPGLGAKLQTRLNDLAALEKDKEKSLDRLADCSARMLTDAGGAVAGAELSGDIFDLLYNAGRFVYFADAADDLGDDFKKKRFNPLINAFGGFTDRAGFIAARRKELEFIFYTAANKAAEALNRLEPTGARDLLQNIVYRGLRKKTEELLCSVKKLPKPRI